VTARRGSCPDDGRAVNCRQFRGHYSGCLFCEAPASLIGSTPTK
jgi:hypothetical protein